MKNKQKSANEFINIADIKDNILYTKDNHIVMYIKIPPISISAMSGDEKNVIIKNLTKEFADEMNVIKFFKIGRPIDITNLSENYRELYSNSKNYKQRELLKNSINFLHKHSTNNSELENKFYMILYDNYTETNEKELEKRAIKYVKNLQIGGFKNAGICKGDEIAKLCNLFANPSYAHLENMDIEEVNVTILND